jgi:hypothetical protein
MKFMVSWSIDQDKRQEVLKVWSSQTPEQQMDAGPGVKILGRWHNVVEFVGVAIVEADDAGALNSMMDMDVCPVLDDAETTAVGKKALGL